MTPRPRARRWAVPLAGLLLALCLSGAALIGAFSPIALAKRSHTGTTQSPAATTPAEGVGGTAAEETAPSEAGKGAAKAHREKRAARKSPAASPGEAPSAESAPAAGSSHKGKAHRGEAKAKRQARKTGQTGAGSAEEGTAAPLQINSAVQNTSKRHKEIERERRRERREARKAKEREKEAGGGGEGAGEERSGGSGTTPTPVPLSSPVASASAPPTTSSAPTVGASRSQPGKGNVARHHHNANAARRPNRISPALIGASALPSLPTAASGAERGTESGKSKPNGSPGRSDSPLSRTVTRIIGVIPAFIRYVIAGLMALALGLALNTRLATRRAERLTRQRRELLEDVGLLQAALLPELPDTFDAVGTTAAYRPASGPAAGGDFYDVFALEDGRLAVIVGDVSGHGRKALPHTTLVRFTLRAYLEVGMSPRAALQSAAPVLERQLGGSFATVVLATYDPAHRSLLYSCAGHPPPVLAGAQSLSPITACSAPPIGVGWPTGTRQTEIFIPGGARACFYTDGVIEAKLAGGLFGVERLKDVLSELASDDGASELLDRVAAQSDQHPDDMAACLLDIGGEPQPPEILVEEVEVHRHELRGERLRSFLSAGGLSKPEIEGVITQATSAVLRDGGVVLKLRPGPRPRVELAHNNIARMRITARSLAGATEVAV